MAASTYITWNASTLLNITHTHTYNVKWSGMHAPVCYSICKYFFSLLLFSLSTNILLQNMQCISFMWLQLLFSYIIGIVFDKWTSNGMPVIMRTIILFTQFTLLNVFTLIRTIYCMHLFVTTKLSSVCVPLMAWNLNEWTHKSAYMRAFIHTHARTRQTINGHVTK